MTFQRIENQIDAGRWRAVGRAVILHNGSLTIPHQRRIALINHGPRAILASFTAAEVAGLRGWERTTIHLLAPPGTRRFTDAALPEVKLHRSPKFQARHGQRVELLAPALIRAAGSFVRPRPGCAILAAAVQQRLVGAAELNRAAAMATRVRHRAAMLTAIGDIAMGAQALSEIDFVRLCRDAGLPPPRQQVVRRDSQGRRRYLDATWDLPDGRTLVVEVDGALHLEARQWKADQLRQNEIVIGGALVLRFPSDVIRHEPQLVIAQLRRLLPTL